MPRLLRSGRWLTAYREALGQQRLWGDAAPAWRQVYCSARTAFVPHWARQMRRRLTYPRRLERAVHASIISADFARRVAVLARLKTLDGHRGDRPLPSYGAERATFIEHPFLTVGRERYDRVAASVGIEARDPFLDRRVVDFCLTLPGEQLLGGGWSKSILRRAMVDRLPDAVRWRRGKEDLGWPFTAAFIEIAGEQIRTNLDENAQLLKPYVDLEALQRVRQAAANGGEVGEENKQTEYNVAHLASWLSRHQQRPQVVDDCTIAQSDGTGTK